MTALPVSEQPIITLTHWHPIMHTMLGYRLVGIATETGKARISSPLVGYDVETGTAVTESGRIYVLEGPHDHAVGAEIVRQLIAGWDLTVTNITLAEPWELSEFLPDIDGVAQKPRH